MRGEPLRPVPKPPKAAKRNARARGKYAEQKVADQLGGRLTISSGRTAVEKGDVRVQDTIQPLFLEVKYTGERQGRAEGSITVPWEWFEKTLLDARAANCLPLVALRYANRPTTIYCSTDETFQHLVLASRVLNHIRQAQPDVFDEAVSQVLG